MTVTLIQDRRTVEYQAVGFGLMMDAMREIGLE